MELSHDTGLQVKGTMSSQWSSKHIKVHIIALYGLWIATLIALIVTIAVYETKMSGIKDMLTTRDKQTGEHINSDDEATGPPGVNFLERMELLEQEYANLNTKPQETEAQEFGEITRSLPFSANAAYVRLGRASCPENATMIYNGVMAGPNRTSSGGGVNFQCLPDDPAYVLNTTFKAPNSDLFSVIYTPNPDVPHPGRGVPCAVCETFHRPIQLMIPAKRSCPTDWFLEYEGFLMSSPMSNADGSSFGESYHRSTYECVDIDMQPTNQSALSSSYTGSWLYMVKIQCSAEGDIRCPPFEEVVTRPLSCVVCSK